MKHKGGPCTASPCLMPNTTPNVYHFHGYDQYKSNKKYRSMAFLRVSKKDRNEDKKTKLMP